MEEKQNNITPENETIFETRLYSVTLEDGTVIENLKLNGNNFVSDKEITPEIFDGNLGTVVISDGETEDIHHNMALVQVTKMKNEAESKDEYWFILRDVPASEIEQAKLRSDLDYVMMMTDIEI